MAADAGVGISGIGQVALTVDDVERAIAFYRDVLGMRFLFEIPDQGMAFLDCGDGTRLYLAHAESPAFRSDPAVYYKVASVEAAHQALVDAGAEILSPPHQVHHTTTVDTWMCFTKDPDGNAVALMEERPAS